MVKNRTAVAPWRTTRRTANHEGSTTPLAPVTIGRMIDAGVSMEAIAVLSAIHAAAGMGLVAVAFRRR